MPSAGDFLLGRAKGVRRKAGQIVFRAPIKVGRAFQWSARGPWVPSLGLMGRDHLGTRRCPGRDRGQSGCLGPCPGALGTSTAFWRPMTRCHHQMPASMVSESHVPESESRIKDRRREGSPVGRGSWPFFHPLNLTAPPPGVVSSWPSPGFEGPCHPGGSTLQSPNGTIFPTALTILPSVDARLAEVSQRRVQAGDRQPPG